MRGMSPSADATCAAGSTPCAQSRNFPSISPHDMGRSGVPREVDASLCSVRPSLSRTSSTERIRSVPSASTSGEW